MTRNLGFALALALGAGAASFAPSMGPRQAHAVTVAVAPADTVVDIGTTFQLRVVSSAFPDLKAYKLQFGYAPGVLQFLGATAGDVLTGTGQPFVVEVVPDHVAPADTAHVDCAQLVGSTSGPGVLVYLAFKAVGSGDSPIACAGADFRDRFNVSTIPACAPGRVQVVRPVGALPATWGRCKGLYR